MATYTSSYKAVFALLAVSALPHNVKAQAPASKPDPLAQSLMAVGDTFGFNPKKIGPFHLKAYFDTFGADGKPDGSGTLNEYGDGKGKLRRTITYRGKTQTTLLTPGLEVSGDFHEPFFVRRLVAGFEHPIPPVSALDDRTFEDKQQTFGSMPMHCILTKRKPQPGHSQPEVREPLGSPDEDSYCLSTDDRFLRVQQSFPAISLAYNALSRFNGQVVPFTLTLSQGIVVRGELHVDTLEAGLPDDATFLPTAEAKPSPDFIDYRDTVHGPSPVSQRQPSYPPIAKQAHAAGSVIMAAILSAQGTVSNLEVISGNAMLSPAATEAVSEWRYKPFFVDGKPVEVDTIIIINFAFGVGPMIPGIR